MSISEPLYPYQPQYTVEDAQGNRLRVFRDNLQLLPSDQPRVTSLSHRPLYPGFRYREIQRQQAREARTFVQPQVSPIVITGEMRRRRRPSVWLQEYYIE